jgi:ABC-type multidrug transport system ATPase subunit
MEASRLKDISFEIKKGYVYGILGPNGSGKSTTLGIVLNVVNKTSENTAGLTEKWKPMML